MTAQQVKNTDKCIVSFILENTQIFKVIIPFKNIFCVFSLPKTYIEHFINKLELENLDKDFYEFTNEIQVNFNDKPMCKLSTLLNQKSLADAFLATNYESTSDSLNDTLKQYYIIEAPEKEPKESKVEKIEPSEKDKLLAKIKAKKQQGETPKENQS
jgi:hypothetical protein